jgi:hypothetical protein
MRVKELIADLRAALADARNGQNKECDRANQAERNLQGDRLEFARLRSDFERLKLDLDLRTRERDTAQKQRDALAWAYCDKVLGLSPKA